MIPAIAEKLAEIIGVVVLHAAAEHVVTEPEALFRALSHSTVYRSRRIRVSVAQLLSIQDGDRFILVANQKRPERLAPIGGVTRYYPSGISFLEHEIGFQSQFTEGPERFDLRGFVLGKNFAAFIRWFYSELHREKFAIAREIEEEFLEIGIPEIAEMVRRPEFRLLRTVHQGPFKVAGFDYWQYRYFEVFCLEDQAENSKALAAFIRHSAKSSRHLAHVSKLEIERGRSGNNLLISDSAGYLFGKNRSGPEPPPFLVAHPKQKTK